MHGMLLKNHSLFLHKNSHLDLHIEMDFKRTLCNCMAYHHHNHHHRRFFIILFYFVSILFFCFCSLMAVKRKIAVSAGNFLFFIIWDQ